MFRYIETFAGAEVESYLKEKLIGFALGCGALVRDPRLYRTFFMKTLNDPIYYGKISKTASFGPRIKVLAMQFFRYTAYIEFVQVGFQITSL